MKPKKLRNLSPSIFIASAVILTLPGCGNNESVQRDLILWYNTPAAEWRESLPIGNGRLGTMIAGNVESDTMVINEETMWSGGIHNYINPNARSHLEEIRDLISSGKYTEALELGDDHMIGIPRRQQFYQPLGRLIINVEHQGETAGYKRALDLSQAVISIDYQNGGYAYKREIFASYPDDVVVMRFTTDNDDGQEIILKHDSEHRSAGKLDGNIFRLSGNGDEGRGIEGEIRFTSCLEVEKGTLSMDDQKDGLKISGDKEILILYTAATNYRKYNDQSASPSRICDEILGLARLKNYTTLLKNHISDYSTLFDRVKISLGSEEFPTVPTDQLIEWYKDDVAVPYLEELFYQVGRYLVIASSRPGNQPMNLHETGSRVAKEHYGCRGFVAHHNTDIWRGAAETIINFRDQYIPSYEMLGSWVSGTRANFWARLNNGTEAYSILRRTIHHSMFSNLLMSFYTGRYFMIDGNLGTAAAMNEMLVQSQRTGPGNEVIIDLLPALPENWKNGYIKGVRTRGGFELDLTWEHGAMKTVKIYSERGNNCQLVYNDQQIPIKLEPEESATWKLNPASVFPGACCGNSDLYIIKYERIDY